ncbi:phosphonate ABC transporter, permease protein PhnE [Natronorubrum daqingense]|uniref:Phosphonate ABC transporter, permease protein PhnE n=1 Tax=Natronorubrum daqingense TaxID=588898 RepID=A0A1N7EW89_9EURY|nr:phosphonate ABC transporter, permease protein PhnE [Natronorubrum daqingense]APX97673.1 phosphonate ABC transporter, permease protein PhnE [Natronorubrum daqingense]SIR92334.1 phosphonate transport system permease protein [Natronorubrum daqingense]
MFEPTADDYERWQRHDVRTRLLRFATVLITVPIVVYSWRILGINYDYLSTAGWAVGDLLGRMYPPNHGYTGEIVGPMIETINIAILGTGLSALLSIPIAYLAASNTTPNRITYVIGRLVITVTRTVSTIIWAIMFVILFGPGAFAGVIAVAIRSIGFIGKLLSEAIEEIDPGQVRALEAAGANDRQQLIYGVAPQVKPLFVGITTHRWDINIRSSTVLGLVGAGGIGLELTARMDVYQWQSVSVILLAILVTVLLSELISAKARSAVS